MNLCQKCKHASELWTTSRADRVACVSPPRIKNKPAAYGVMVQVITHNQRDECEFFEERNAISI